MQNNVFKKAFSGDDSDDLSPVLNEKKKLEAKKPIKIEVQGAGPTASTKVQKQYQVKKMTKQEEYNLEADGYNVQKTQEKKFRPKTAGDRGGRGRGQGGRDQGDKGQGGRSNRDNRPRGEGGDRGKDGGFGRGKGGKGDKGNQEDKPKKVCFNCYEKSCPHLAKDCPKPRKERGEKFDKGKSDYKKDRENKPKPKKVCYNCNDEKCEYLAKDCPKPRQERPERNRDYERPERNRDYERPERNRDYERPERNRDYKDDRGDKRGYRNGKYEESKQKEDSTEYEEVVAGQYFDEYFTENKTANMKKEARATEGIKGVKIAEVSGTIKDEKLVTKAKATVDGTAKTGASNLLGFDRYVSKEEKETDKGGKPQGGKGRGKGGAPRQNKTVLKKYNNEDFPAL